MNTYSIKEKKEIYSIQYARGFAALFVFSLIIKTLSITHLPLMEKGLATFFL